MRIVHVAPNHERIPPEKDGGTERIVYALCEAQAKMGHEVYLYASINSTGSARIIHYPFITRDDKQIEKFVRDTLISNVDLIHDHTFNSVIGRKRLSIPTVCTLHLPKKNDVAYPVYLSKRALDLIGGGIGQYVYNGIDLNEFPLIEQKKDYMLFMGRVIREKGVLHAIDVAERTRKQLIIAGPLHDYIFFKNEVKPRIKALRNVKYIGSVGGEERIQLLSQARCVLFPSTWEEPFGLVMVEAMACGTPVLALNSGSVTEVLAGFPELICRKVGEMVTKALKLPLVSPKALRAYVSENFSVDRMVKDYMDIYHHLVMNNASAEHIDTQTRHIPQFIQDDRPVFFTTATNKRLHEARVLAESVKTHHPDSIFVLCLVEEAICPDAKLENNIDEIVLAKDLGIRQFSTFIFKYDKHEAIHAVKGKMYQYLMEKYIGNCNFIFLESTMLVTDCFQELLEEMNRGASIILTPHHSSPSITWDCWDEMGTLKYGTFQSGLMALRRSSVSERFVKWFCTRLERFCFQDPEVSLFYDQKWLNLAPAFFDVTVMRHEGYNLAGWNLHERKLFRSTDGSITVNQKLLRCINFTNDSGILDSYMNLYIHDKNNLLYELRKKYLQRLDEEEKYTQSWSYSHFQGGEKINKSSRIKYRNNLELEHSFPNPFALTNQHFI